MVLNNCLRFYLCFAHDTSRSRCCLRAGGVCGLLAAGPNSINKATAYAMYVNF